MNHLKFFVMTFEAENARYITFTARAIARRSGEHFYWSGDQGRVGLIFGSKSACQVAEG